MASQSILMHPTLSSLGLASVPLEKLMEYFQKANILFGSSIKMILKDQKIFHSIYKPKSSYPP